MSNNSNNYLKKLKEATVDDIKELVEMYPAEFLTWAENHPNDITLPSLKSLKGKALSLMLHNPDFYFTPKVVRELEVKFNIRKLDGTKSADIIQAFNKIPGLKTNSETGKYSVPYPYRILKGRDKSFSKLMTKEEKIEEVNNIKEKINDDYIDIPSEEWQFGHKNPNNGDNSDNNLVLQPPIQGKYRDNYIFFDTLTKFPVPKKLSQMIKKEEVKFSKDQIKEYYELFKELKELID